MREEFDYFWERGVDLPDAVIEHIGTVARRAGHRDIAEWRETGADPAPALVERPLYRAGNLLHPWQKRFVQTCLEQQRRHGKARLLIADDVGLGKTLSLGAATLVLSLLSDRPVLILAPATLVWQWQVELADMLGLPACVWSTRLKCWLDPAGFPLSGRGVEHITRCPMRIGIVSTGLVVNGGADGERGLLERLRFGVLVLDEAHKARARRDRNGKISGRNNLMDFMHRAATRADHGLLRPIAVRVHPRAGELPAAWLDGQALRMGLAFEHAYDNALAFCRKYARHRPAVGLMNLRYAGTVEDEVYAALSARFQDIFQVLGQLPDSFEEEWVATALRDVADDSGLDWESCERIIAAHDIQAYMRSPWR